jgi:hypothetical protein
VLLRELLGEAAESVDVRVLLRGAPQLAQPAGMVSVRQALDRSSSNPVGDSEDIHAHRAETIRRRGAATSGDAGGGIA